MQQQQNLWFLRCSIPFDLMVCVCVYACVRVCVMHAYIPGQVFTFVTSLFIHLLGLLPSALPQAATKLFSLLTGCRCVLCVFFPPLRSSPKCHSPSSNKSFIFSPLRSAPQYCTPSSNRMFFTSKSSPQSVHEGKGGWDAVTNCGRDMKSRPEVDAWSICKLVWNALAWSGIYFFSINGRWLAMLYSGTPDEDDHIPVVQWNTWRR